MLRKILISIIICIGSPRTLADIVFLENGDRISGDIKRIWGDILIIEPQYSDPIEIGNNYLILKINQIKEIAIEIDKQKELDKMIMVETSSQLDKFSNIFYNKIKLNSTISEF